MILIEIGIIGIIGFLFLFWVIPEYFKLLGRSFAEGLTTFVNETLDQQFDIFYENQVKSKEKENENG